MPILKLSVDPQAKLAVATPKGNEIWLAQHEVRVQCCGFKPMHPPVLKLPQVTFPSAKVTNMRVERLGGEGPEHFPFGVFDDGEDGAGEAFGSGKHGAEGEAVKLGAVQEAPLSGYPPASG